MYPPACKPSFQHQERKTKSFLTMRLTIILAVIICLQFSAKGEDRYKAMGPGETKKTKSQPEKHTYQQKITGRVLSESGEPLPGVSVIIKGSNTGTTTDANGNFSITAPDDAILVFSAVGYDSVEESISGKSTMSISLKLSSKVMDQVIVVGYGTQRKIDITGS